jgi:hypothetical protein
MRLARSLPTCAFWLLDPFLRRARGEERSVDRWQALRLYLVEEEHLRVANKSNSEGQFSIEILSRGNEQTVESPFVPTRVRATWLEGVLRQADLIDELQAANVKGSFSNAPNAAKEPEGLVAGHQIQQRVSLRAIADQTSGGRV